MIRTIRHRCLLVAIGTLLAACGPSGASAPAANPASVSATVAPLPSAKATIRVQGTSRATPIIAAATQTAARTATAPSAIPGAVGAGCDNAALTALVTRFLDAYNAGDQARLLAFFPVRDATRGLLVPGETTYFQRYWDVRKPSLRDEDGFAAYARAELPTYWAQRHAQHERLRLRRFQACDRAWTGNVGFTFELTRQADDLPLHAVLGKGEIDSDQSTIVLWSMGPQEQPAATPTHP